MKHLNIDPQKGGEIISLSANREEYHGDSEYWNVSVSFRLYKGGPQMDVDTYVQTKDWEK
jgi:hypothetical protein